MKCNCKNEWKSEWNAKHSPECAKKRVAWWIKGMKESK